MYKWLDNIDLRTLFFTNYDFFILMEWFNALNLIKPICVLEFQPERFKDAKFTITTNSFELEEFYKNGLISFPKEIYDIEKMSPKDVKNWNFQIFTLVPPEKESYRKYDKYDLIRYLYHPIQFFQLLTYLRGSTYRNLWNKKDFVEFY